jgi:hypothetical protein
MTCSVNLVPLAHRHARASARRRIGWLIAGAVLGVVALAGWGGRYLAGRALNGLRAQVTDLETQQTVIRNRLAVAETRRDAVYTQLRSIAAARRPQPWAHRLVALTNAAPEGVFLTQFSLLTPKQNSGVRRPTWQAAADAEEAAPAETREEPLEQQVRLTGYAGDHGALIQLLNRIQQFPDWRQVELVHAASQPYGNGMAVAFELDCRTREEQP